MTTKKERTTGLFAEFWHDYSSFLPGMNWRDFCLVHIGGEWDHLMGRLEWELCVLGLWYRGVFVYNDRTPMQVKLRRMAEHLTPSKDA